MDCERRGERTAAACRARRCDEGPPSGGLCRRSDARVSTLARAGPRAIRARRRADLDAIEEMLALGLQRLARLQLDRQRLPAFMGSRHAVPPFDAVRIQQELAFPRLPVVEHGHGLAADDDELLLLEGMQP